MKQAIRIVGIALALGWGTASGWSQATQKTESAQTPQTVQPARTIPPDMRQGPISTQIFYLTNVVQSSEGNDFITALRNMVDAHDRIFFVSSQDAIIVQAGPEDMALTQKILAGLDRPKKTYRLTYTVTEMDNGKRVGTQHFAMIVVAGQRTLMKQGSKIPIATGSYKSPGTTNNETQFQYTDVGMSFDATLEEFASGVRLRSNVEQSSVADEKSSVGFQDPVIRISHLEGTAFLSPGKPMILGSLDVPGSTRHLDVEVVMEQAQ